MKDAFDQLKTDLLKDEPLNMLIEKFVSEICRSMKRIKLQPEIGLAEIKDIVDTIADKEGTALKSMLQGELVLSKEVWQKLIELKFEVTVDQGEQIMKQMKEGFTYEMQKHQRRKVTYEIKLHTSSSIEARLMSTTQRLLKDLLS